MTADEKVNILMVDDEPSKLLSYEVILAELGENLIKAKSAPEALSILLKTDVAVVLMDVSMPEWMDLSSRTSSVSTRDLEDRDHLHFRRAPFGFRSHPGLSQRSRGLHIGAGGSRSTAGQSRSVCRAASENAPTGGNEQRA